MNTTSLRHPHAHHDHDFSALSGVRKLGAFLVWVLTGFGLFTHLWRHRRSRGAAEEVVVYSVHRALYLWPLILAGFLGAALVHRHPDWAGAWGWAYVVVMMYTLVTLLFDLGTLRLLLWTGVCALVWVTSSYMEDLRHVPVLSRVGDYLGGLHPSLDAGTAAVMSWLLLVPWVGALFYAFGRGRKTFSPNSVEEWFIGEGREIIDRSGLKFRSRYRDLFETALGFGAGDLEAVDSNGQVVKRWENVLFLAFIWRRLDEILHQRAAVVDVGGPDEDAEHEELATAVRA